MSSVKALRSMIGMHFFSIIKIIASHLIPDVYHTKDRQSLSWSYNEPELVATTNHTAHFCRKVVMCSGLKGGTVVQLSL